MRTIIHLSDLHFGRIDQTLIAPLIEQVLQLAPDLVVVSGDLTQRATSGQFKAARAFLDRLPQPQLVVPGNHDISLHNLFSRFVLPLGKYRKFVTPELEPVFADDEIAVLGINTVRSLTFKDGRINREQIARLRSRLSDLGTERTKIIVTHHPFDLPEHFHERRLVDRAPLAMAMFAECGVDLLLAGHYHSSYATSSSGRYKTAGYAALVVQAGTATSTRGRGETNSFNVIRVEPGRIAVQRYGWESASASFQPAGSETFDRHAAIWTSVTANIPGFVPSIP